MKIAEKLLGKQKNVLSNAQIIRLCKVSRSTLTEHRKAENKEAQKIASRKAEDKDIKKKMVTIVHKCHGNIPGYRGFRTFLWQVFKMHVGRKRISRLMREMDLKAAVRKKDAYKGAAKHDHPCTAPENLVNQNFKVKPRYIISTDITYLPYGLENGLIYLCIFKDAYTREILGWASGTRMTVSLIQKAYDKMMEDHGKELKTKDVLVHSDQGSQYLSTTFKRLLSDDGFLQSVSARANSQDNAPSESFFGLMKTYLLDQLKLCRTSEDAITMVDGYVNYYNNERYTYSLAGLTPHKFYLFKVSGIYPLDNYYGIKADKLHTIEDIVNDRLKKKAKRAEKMRKEYSERSRTSQLLKKSPVELTIRDQQLLEDRIKHDQDHISHVQEEIDRYTKAFADAKEAEKWMRTLSPEQLDYYRTPQHWRDDPHLQYIWEMGGLF